MCHLTNHKNGLAIGNQRVMVFCVMILCTFTGVLCGTRGDGVRRWWSGTQGIALTGSQMRFERRSEGTRETLRQDKRNAQKRNTAVVCGDYHKGVAICYTLFVVMCGRSRNRTQC